MLVRGVTTYYEKAFSSGVDHRQQASLGLRICADVSSLTWAPCSRLGMGLFKLPFFFPNLFSSCFVNHLKSFRRPRLCVLHNAMSVQAGINVFPFVATTLLLLGVPVILLLSLNNNPITPVYTGNRQGSGYTKQFPSWPQRGRTKAKSMGWTGCFLWGFVRWEDSCCKEKLLQFLLKHCIHHTVLLASIGSIKIT